MTRHAEPVTTEPPTTDPPTTEPPDAAVERIVRDLVGTTITAATVVVERAPVTFLADAVLERSPVFRDSRAAKAAGFSDIPAPPTFAFVMEAWGAFPENQTDRSAEGKLRGVIDALKATGGLILHGEQEFTYHRPLVVGDVLTGDGRITDVYRKASKSATMTFLVHETTWSDKATGEPVVTAKATLIHRLAGER